MSKDFQIAWPCPHLTMEEVVPLGADRRSLQARQPVAGSGTVRILVNDEFFLPQGGLFTSAVLYATVSGSYDLIEGEDTITITSPIGTQTFRFGVSGVARFSADDVVKFLAQQQCTVATASSVNGHLVFLDTSNVGPDSYVKVSGTAATALGFGTAAFTNDQWVARGGISGVPNRQWMSRGVQLYPAWRLQVTNVTTVFFNGAEVTIDSLSKTDLARFSAQTGLQPKDIAKRFPMFDTPVLNNPIFKLTYTVPATKCLRCGASYIENDYRFDAAGQAITIENENLLYQAALKILLTDKGSNPYFDWYGTDLRSRIGTKALSGITSLINEDVRRALIKYQNLQAEQAKYQVVTFEERLYAIQGVQVSPHAQDPTTYMIDVVVQNASGKPIDLSIVFSVPNVVALLGSNGLFLGPQPQ